MVYPVIAVLTVFVSAAALNVKAGAASGAVVAAATGAT
jgi:hypothetical protein